MILAFCLYEKVVRLNRALDNQHEVSLFSRYGSSNEKLKRRGKSVFTARNLEPRGMREEKFLFQVPLVFY